MINRNGNKKKMKRKFTEEGKLMLRFWRTMAKCQPLKADPESEEKK